MAYHVVHPQHAIQGFVGGGSHEDVPIVDVHHICCVSLAFHEVKEWGSINDRKDGGYR
jgi:hypothetical protein